MSEQGCASGEHDFHPPVVVRGQSEAFVLIKPLVREIAVSICRKCGKSSVLAGWTQKEEQAE